MEHLIKINKVLIKANPSAEMMVDLGLRLLKWWKKQSHLVEAEKLFESAIICRRDRLAMVSLAMINVQSEIGESGKRVAALLLDRAIKETRSDLRNTPSIVDRQKFVQSYVKDLKDIDPNIGEKMEEAYRKYGEHPELLKFS